MNGLTSKSSSQRNILLERQAMRTGSPLTADRLPAERRETDKKAPPPLLDKPAAGADVAQNGAKATVVKKKKKKKNSVTANLGGTKYEVSK